ncbi:M1 family metallopeptidase [Pollutibacter soli]|uniref:M1 family metallopeptidase n=1 Tax=Pollutibacter soli TaxID=3034157 RepID=UPI0030140032
MKYFITVFFALASSLLSNGQDNYWQQYLKYDIDVKLDDSLKTLDGYLKLIYRNNSPDTLSFIWFHLWPNAYKNDRTALTDQTLENGRTDFYFAPANRRGYINRLDFRINDEPQKLEDHPSDIDIVKMILEKPLGPGEEVLITTPYHVKLPYNYSRGGYYQKTFQITQWYPKPAVYDRHGWHEMPYLDQGEFYSEFGDFTVDITVPSYYKIAATGMQIPSGNDSTGDKYKNSADLTTYRYQQDSVHDFAWFADREFVLLKDSVQLESGKNVLLQVYRHGLKNKAWNDAMDYLKEAIVLHSKWIGEYPWPVATVVEGYMGFAGGMEYPTITILHTPGKNSLSADLIFHEVGHNWFYGILANNERSFPWMDEGFNSFYDNRYRNTGVTGSEKKEIFSTSTIEKLPYQTLASLKLDQPINTPADSLTAVNAAVISYLKTADWLKKIEDSIGRTAFDEVMQAYYQKWKFKHPYPEDFYAMLKEHGPQAAEMYPLINKTGMLSVPVKRIFKVAPFIAPNPDLKYNYLFIAPLVGFNNYDGFMAGALFHNYTAPVNKFLFAVAPMYGFKSKKLDGIGRVSYRWHPDHIFRNVEIFANASRFTMEDFTDEGGNRLRLSFNKIVPGFRLEFKEKSARSTLTKYIGFKQFLINEEQLSFYRDTIRQLNLANKVSNSYGISQLSLGVDQYRALYPYNAELRMEASGDFGRLTFTGNYFFNYKKKGGINLRLFAGKFFYFTDKNSTSGYATNRYHLNMTGPKGDEDYTYSNYFAGRNEFEGFYSQQIMMRDGAFKVRTDMLSNKIGKTDDWLTAMNLTVDIPDKLNPLSLLPVDIPIRIFVDAGTYSQVWEKDNTDPRVVFDGGFQVSLLWNMVNIYIPVVYSDVYKDYFKSVPGNKFWNRISFSIDIPVVEPRKMITQVFRKAANKN